MTSGSNSNNGRNSPTNLSVLIKQMASLNRRSIAARKAAKTRRTKQFAKKANRNQQTAGGNCAMGLPSRSSTRVSRKVNRYIVKSAIKKPKTHGPRQRILLNGTMSSIGPRRENVLLKERIKENNQLSKMLNSFGIKH